MTSVTISQARENFADCADDVYFRNKRICVKRRGKPVLVMIPMTDYELLKEAKTKRAADVTKRSLKRGKFVEMEDSKTR